MRRLAGFAKAVRAVAFLPDGRLVAAGEDKWVRVFDPSSGECAAAVKSRQVVYAVAASPDGKAVAYAGRYGTLGAGSNAVFTFNPDVGRAVNEFFWDMGAESRSIWSLSYSADGDYLAAACFYPDADRNGSGAHWWRCRKPIDDGQVSHATATAVRFAPSGCALAIAHRAGGGTVSVFDRPGGVEIVTALLGHARPHKLDFLGSNGSVVATAGSHIDFVDPDQKLVRVKTGEHTLTALAASPDGRTLLAAGRSGVVECYDAQTRALRSRHDFGVGPIHALAFAPDGLTFAVAGEGGVAVCDAE